MPHVILRPGFLSFRNRFYGNANWRKNLKRDALFAGVTGLTMLCIFAGCSMVLGATEGDPLFEQIAPVKILQLSFYAFFLMLLISNTIAAVGNFYTSDSLSLLGTIPLSTTRLFTAKLIQTLTETGTMYVVFSLPVALAFMLTLDLPADFIARGILVSIPFLLIPAGLAIVLATGFVSIASVVWRRGAVFTCLAIAVIGWGLYSFSEMVSAVQFEKGGTNAIVQLVGLFRNPNPTWLPSFWSSEILTAFLGESYGDEGVLLQLLWSAALGSLALAFLSYDLFGLRVRSAALKHDSHNSEKKSDFVRKGLELVLGAVPMNQHVRAVVLKDLSSLIRDRAQALQLLLYLGIAVFYLTMFKFMSAAVHLTPTSTQLWWSFLACLNVLFSGFILTAVITRLVYPSISLEGKAFWILLVAPISLDRLLQAKFWCWFPIICAISVMLTVAGGLAIGVGPSTLFFSVLIGISLSTACTALAIGLGARFATFQWESPNKISAGLGTLVLLMSSLTAVIWTALPASVLIVLSSVPRIRELLGPLLTFAAMAVSLFLLLYVAIGIARWANKQGSDALRLKKSNSFA